MYNFVKKIKVILMIEIQIHYFSQNVCTLYEIINMKRLSMLKNKSFSLMPRHLVWMTDGTQFVVPCCRRCLLYSC